eukprot:TRINITY_DN1655_c0_g3_i1.p1 TRINITY_DN1655_c0_g3~~TRINITY_DN1655_c0_g3_i1.p1  ORF type:complete len:733 (-),score=27.58 TRINITY_DN1655_c0_g3_i1:67-2265(-)
MYFVVTFLVISIWAQDILQVKEECSDITPDYAPFTCEEYFLLDFCSGIKEVFCRRSCGRCGCIDVLLPGMESCEAIIENDACKDPKIFGKFCNKSCRYCEDGNDFPIISSSPTPTLPTIGIDCSSESALSCDAEALIRFKESLTRGIEVLDSWVGEDPCGWDYITCFNVSMGSYRVAKVDLHDDDIDYRLTGTLVPDWSNLRYVSHLEIAQQNITGSLPEEYSVLTQLTKFLFQQTELTGTLPTVYTAWKNLIEFVAIANNFEGTIPMEYSLFDRLTKFHVRGNKNLGGTLPPHFSILTNLESFQVVEQKIYGTIPVEWSTWRNIEVIFVWDNKLSGTLHPEFSMFTNLDRIRINHNFFVRTIPLEWSAWKLITEFYAYDNKLSGQVPKQFSEWGNLKRTSVADNKLSGTLHAEFSVFTNLNYININRNLFQGMIPPEWSAWELITNFYVYDNLLTGQLPEQFSEWKSVMYVVLGKQMFTGILPEAYSAMSRMQRFQVERNNLVGTLPTQYSTWKNCTQFAAYANELTGTLPKQYSNMLYINMFWVQDNQLSGIFPIEYSTMRELEKMDLSVNFFTPKIKSNKEFLFGKYLQSSKCRNQYLKSPVFTTLQNNTLQERRPISIVIIYPPIYPLNYLQLIPLIINYQNKQQLVYVSLQQHLDNQFLAPLLSLQKSIQFPRVLQQKVRDLYRNNRSIKVKYGYCQQEERLRYSHQQFKLKILNFFFRQFHPQTRR